MGEPWFIPRESKSDERVLVVRKKAFVPNASIVRVARECAGDED